MNPGLAKELQALRLAWSVCAITDVGNLIGLFSQGVFARFLMAIAAFAFFAGCLVLAAAPFGYEFPLRTWPLLLGQPLERSRLWRTKLLAGTIAILALVAVHGATMIVSGQKLLLGDVLPGIGFVAATICSAGWCALTARSVIGGAAFAACCQFLIMLLVSGGIFLSYKISGRDPDESELAKAPVVITYIIAGAVYAAFTLWLGWRTFKQMEIRDATAVANLALPDWFTPKAVAALFRCQPTGVLGNLIRKEVGLQKPIFTLAVVFAACWMLTLMLYFLQPSRSELWKGILNGLTAAYIAIIALVSGCVSLGDEKSLGLSAWHLTLPVSVRRQWLVKFMVTFATALVLAIILPLFLSGLALVKAKVGLIAMTGGEIQGVLLVVAMLWVLVVQGFWCASFWRNTVHAALASIASLIVLVSAAQLGALVPMLHFRSGLQANALANMVAHFQLQPDCWWLYTTVLPYGISLIILATTVVALVQSLAEFRRAETRSLRVVKCSAVLAAMIFAGSFWQEDLRNSRIRLFQFERESRTALTRLPDYTKKIAAGEPWVVSLQELEQTGQLSELTRTWLRNSSITVYPGISGRSVAEVRLPNQRQFQISAPFARVPVKPPTKPEQPEL